MSDHRAIYRKSRGACQNCKTRKVKCDEQRPICGGCKLRGRDCLYLTTTQAPQKSAPSRHESNRSLSTAQTSPTVDSISTSTSTSTPQRSSISSRTSHRPAKTSTLFPDLLQANDGTIIEFSESKERRLLEIRLMTHMVQNMLVSPGQTDRWLAHWREAIPKLAVSHDAVLYASCALSAGNLLQHPDGVGDFDVLQSARQNYMLLALREQRHLCEFIDETNAEAICLSASILLQTTFTLMQDPSPGQDPLESAIEWVKMGKGVERMLWKISAALSPNEPPNAFKIFHRAYQRVREQWREQATFDEPFASIWAFIYAKEQSAENREIYRRTLVYISWIHRHGDSGEPSVVVERRLQTFGVQSPAEFVEFLEERRPIALAVLAYFFGVVAQVEGHYWWLQPLQGTSVTVSSRQIQAIKNHLDESYHSILIWPLQKAKLRV